MTDRDLATLVREHVSHDEPPFLLSPETSIALGRRTLVRRRARRAAAGALVAAAAIAAVPLLPFGGSTQDDVRIDPATAHALEHYEAKRMPVLIDQHVRGALGHGLDGLGQAEFAAFDDQGTNLPERYYDKASSMSVDFRGTTGDRRVSVTLLHSRSEAEGNARKNCAADLAGGIDFSCVVTTSDAGDTVTTTVRALLPMDRAAGAGWALVTRSELSKGVTSTSSALGEHAPIDPARVYFVRSVESVHSDTFLTQAEEYVRAPDLATARKLWQVPVADLEKVVTDPALVIPKPPLGPNGCAWMLHPEGISCSKG